MQLLVAFGSGLVFGLGLLLSGLMNPAKVFPLEGRIAA